MRWLFMSKVMHVESITSLLLSWNTWYFIWTWLDPFTTVTDPSLSEQLGSMFNDQLGSRQCFWFKQYIFIQLQVTLLTNHSTISRQPKRTFKFKIFIHFLFAAIASCSVGSVGKFYNKKKIKRFWPKSELEY